MNGSFRKVKGMTTLKANDNDWTDLVWKNGKICMNLLFSLQVLTCKSFINSLKFHIESF